MHARREDRRPGPVQSWHIHPDYHIVYVIRGSGKIIIDTETYDATAGDLFFVNPNDLHRFFADAKDPFGYYEVTFQLRDEDGQRCLRNIFDLMNLDLYLSLGARRVPIPKAYEEGLCKLFVDVMGCCQSGHRFIREQTPAYLIALLFGIAALLQDMSLGIARKADLDQVNDPTAAMIRKAEDYIRSKHSGPLKIGEVAAHVHLHPSYFSQVFKTYVGLAPHQFLLNVRMEHARKMLYHTTLSIAEIAASCGFKSPGYFARTFRRLHGTTPLSFRKELPSWPPDHVSSVKSPSVISGE